MVSEPTPDTITTPSPEDGEVPVVAAEAPVEPSAEVLAPPAVEEAPLPPAPIATPPAESSPKPEVLPQPSAEEQRLQQEVSALRQQQTTAQQQQTMAALAQEARNNAAARAQKYVEQGQITEEQAPLFAQELEQGEAEKLQLQYQAFNWAQSLQLQTTTAADLASKYGVSHTELMQFNSAQAMEAHAKTQSRIKFLEEREAKRTKAQVPAQQFSHGVTETSAGGLEGEALELAVGNGTVEFTPAVAERLIKYQRSQGFRS
jgi:hypothetical protein